MAHEGESIEEVGFGFNKQIISPAILTDIAYNADAIVANFGALDTAMFDVLTGVVEPKGHLPFELPSSWSAVLDQNEDVPYDSVDPLYEYGFGLSY